MSKDPNMRRLGETNPNHRLTAAQVLEIYASKSIHRETARRYGVSRQTVAAIRTGQRWGWLTGAAGGTK